MTEQKDQIKTDTEKLTVSICNFFISFLLSKYILRPNLVLILSKQRDFQLKLDKKNLEMGEYEKTWNCLGTEIENLNKKLNTKSDSLLVRIFYFSVTQQN